MTDSLSQISSWAQFMLQQFFCRNAESMREQVFRRVANELAAAESDPQLFRESFYRVQPFLVFGPNVYQIVANASLVLLDGYVQPVSDRQIGTNVSGECGFTTVLHAELQALANNHVDQSVDLSFLQPAGTALPGTKIAAGAYTTAQVLEQLAQERAAAGWCGRQRLTLRADHPDIEAVLAPEAVAGFERSQLCIAVPDALLSAAAEKRDFALLHASPPPGVAAESVPRDAAGRYEYRRVAASTLCKRILEYLQQATPGEAGRLLFVDRLPAHAPLTQAHPTAQTLLPAANLVLPAYAGACSAAINLARLVNSPFTKDAAFDFQMFRYVIDMAVHMLDNVHTLTGHPLKSQHSATQWLRPIALTFTGLANALAMLRLPYGSAEASAFAARMAETLTTRAHLASLELAEHRGPFVGWGEAPDEPHTKDLRERYLQSALIRGLPESLQERIAAKGLRNATVVAMPAWHRAHEAFADGVSFGLDPVFEWTQRHTADSRPNIEHTVEDYAHQVYRDLQLKQQLPRGRLPRSLLLAEAVSVAERVRLHAAVSRHLDGGACLPPLTNLRRISEVRDFCQGIWHSGLSFGATP